MNRIFKLGHPLIDQQHAELHQSFQRLHMMIDAASPAEDVSEELSHLSKMICDHFAEEEVVMRECAVPSDILEAHIKEHDRILHELVSLHEAEMVGNGPCLSKLCLMAEEWILAHLEKFDRPLAGYFNA